MKLLIDENLPATLGTLLPCECLHANALGAQPTDLYLWEFARQNDWTLLTKDADFFSQLALVGSPPKVIWIRTGNLRRVELENRMVELWYKVEEMVQTHGLIEVHSGKLEGLSFSQ